ncbi:hypothetical protein FB451DRAFT_1166171 [Mycena latifolia]|nr:hypothetical protein FB451DRAFT_1166171 [Mycena latifolia]
MGMSLAEAIPWVYPSIHNYPDFKPGLRDLYPDLPDRERMQAWAKANEDSIREAMTVYLTAKADRFPPGVTIDDTGSIFVCCSPEQFHIPIYWNPTTIWCEHEEFAYTVSTPEHVAGLHAIPDRRAAFAYLQAHFDERKPVRPMHITVPDGWDPVAEGTPVPMSLQGRAKTRYTLVDWRKRRVARTTLCTHGIPAVQRYYEEHYDLKEVLDAQENLVSCERGAEYIGAAEMVKYKYFFKSNKSNTPSDGSKRFTFFLHHFVIVPATIIVQILALFATALAVGSVAALPMQDRALGGLNFSGLGLVHTVPYAFSAKVAAAAAININAAIASTSSSVTAVAATATVNPLEPVPGQTFGPTPEELGQLSGLCAKLAIDQQFGDTGGGGCTRPHRHPGTGVEERWSAAFSGGIKRARPAVSVSGGTWKRALRHNEKSGVIQGNPGERRTKLIPRNR